MGNISSFKKGLYKLALVVCTFCTISCSKSIENQTTKLEPLENCRSSVNPQLPQFVIGYGSLMHEDSKREDSFESGDNYPIYLTGFQRGWIEPGTDIGFSTTYLGVIKDAKAKINATYFKLNNSKAIYNYDKREDSYCRLEVSPKQIQALATKKLPHGQYWIYVSRSSLAHSPSQQKPIVQSYVDIFLSGCFQLEKKFHIQNFARDCVRTTNYWSGFWVNDRLYPRTAFDNDPYVAKIDPLLAKELPYYFKQIRIE
ncbi:hypothetical protein BN59_03172 [Legionella massiliensis]|uniref:Gamma-glutamylcyclotransferase AIG2-like domain-containing protein n=1 Tax=Legionella massiliensis TaxID=1034943 RepID=A0A078L0T2_9GAMM|nr:hypothetical protein [Legionella massiliensis]CDZ78857.1 hypothetical protein BN59_03172 [Legionella massiliensis]CEE14595.1 hypothetical protein BN1094_03172 [Legionella massiliensis]